MAALKRITSWNKEGKKNNIKEGEKDEKGLGSTEFLEGSGTKYANFRNSNNEVLWEKFTGCETRNQFGREMLKAIELQMRGVEISIFLKYKALMGK